MIYFLNVEYDNSLSIKDIYITNHIIDKFDIDCRDSKLTNSDIISLVNNNGFSHFSINDLLWILIIDDKFGNGNVFHSSGQYKEWRMKLLPIKRKYHINKILCI
jgi:hypothetical protein